MAFQKALVVAVENGYMVSLTKDELTERGYQSTDKHFIAETLDKALELIREGKGGSAPQIKLVS